MIVKDDNQTRLEFGTGDIGIASGHTVVEEETESVFVVFDNQEPRKIGRGSSIVTGYVSLDDYPVVMTFTKRESINAVIEELEKAKSYMEEKQ